MSSTRVIRQRGVPPGAITEDDFQVAEAPFGEVGQGEVLVRSLLISVDPYLVMRIRAGDFPERIIRSRLIGRVEKSRASGISEGDLVLGFGPWQEMAVIPASELRIIRAKAPLPAYLGVIGHSGYTAKLGMDILDVQPGQTFTVDSAAGAVAAVAGQLARLAGARVVGIAGGEKSKAVVEKLGFNAGVDYKRPDFPASLAKAVPDGIDRHFENVGAAMLDPVLNLINQHTRIALCGLVSHYSDDDPVCLAHFRKLLFRGATISGFTIYDHLDRYEEGLAYLESLYVDGNLKGFETISEGFESLPRALVSMLQGKGFGKHMVRVTDE